MGKVTKDIREALTPIELSKLADEISEHVMRCENLENQKRIVTSDLTSELKRERKSYREKSKLRREGFAWKPIECEEIPDFDRNLVKVKRIDTGVVVDERAMRVDERQTAIEFPDGKPAATASSKPPPVVEPKAGGKRKRLGASETPKKGAH